MASWPPARDGVLRAPGQRQATINKINRTPVKIRRRRAAAPSLISRISVPAADFSQFLEANPAISLLSAGRAAGSPVFLLSMKLTIKQRGTDKIVICQDKTIEPVIRTSQ